MGLRSRMMVTVALCCLGTGAMSEPEREREREREHEGTQQRTERSAPAESHPGPMGYPRVQEPPGWRARPREADRGAYQHNFQAARSYHIGPYHHPAEWSNRQWSYGEILPPAYWTEPYVIRDYWLFGLEIPPVGFEWVRVGSDALLISVSNGEVLQVVYGLFA